MLESKKIQIWAVVRKSSFLVVRAIYTATGLCKQFDFKTDFHLQMGSTIAEKWKSLLNLQKTVAVYYKYNHLGVSEGCDNNISNLWIRPTICKNVEKFKTILASHKKCVWRLTATTHVWLERWGVGAADVVQWFKNQR